MSLPSSATELAFPNDQAGCLSPPDRIVYSQADNNVETTQRHAFPICFRRAADGH
jgi:hypothetical protein